MEIQKLCNRFGISRPGQIINRADYKGPVLATNEALFLVLEQNERGQQIIGKGIAGALANVALSGLDAALRDESVAECELQVDVLPEDVRCHPSLAKVRGDHGVIAIPRNSITTIKITWYSGAVVTTDNLRYSLSIGPFAYIKAQRFLVDSGWIAQ